MIVNAAVLCGRRDECKCVSVAECVRTFKQHGEATGTGRTLTVHDVIRK